MSDIFEYINGYTYVVIHYHHICLVCILLPYIL